MSYISGVVNKVHGIFQPVPQTSTKDKLQRTIAFVAGAAFGGFIVYSYFTPAKDNFMLKALFYGARQMRVFEKFLKKETAGKTEKTISLLQSFYQNQLLPFGITIAEKASSTVNPLISFLKEKVTKENGQNLLIAISEKVRVSALPLFQQAKAFGEKVGEATLAKVYHLYFFFKNVNPDYSSKPSK
jgi:hypothetical protein